MHGEIIYGGTSWIEDDCPDTFSEFCEAQARVRQGSARDGSQGERPQSLNHCPELTLRITMGHLRVTVGHPWLNIGHLKVIMGHLRLTIGYL